LNNVFREFFVVVVAGHEKTSRAAERRQQSDRFGTEKKIGGTGYQKQRRRLRRVCMRNAPKQADPKRQKMQQTQGATLLYSRGGTEMGRASPAQRTEREKARRGDEAAGGKLGILLNGVCNWSPQSPTG